MSIRPDDFLAVAAALQHAGGLANPGGGPVTPNRPTEPFARTVVGRAYYAAFLATREAVRAQYRDQSFDVLHSVLASSLANAVGDPQVTDVGVRLGNMLRRREQADYRLPASVSHLDAALTIADSRAVLTALPAIAGRIPLGIQRRKKRRN